jgi:hypothetical protein
LKDQKQHNRNKFGEQVSTQNGSSNHTQQLHALVQLQKLHQMQKLNQISQMQFFRQQAEMLLSQNLTEQQQLELFQQFSYYQTQISVQSQQYQIIMNKHIQNNDEGSSMTPNMNVFTQHPQLSNMSPNISQRRVVHHRKNYSSHIANLNNHMHVDLL